MDPDVSALTHKYLRIMPPTIYNTHQSFDFQNQCLRYPVPLHPDYNPEDLFAYSSQRWLWNEAQQLRNRYVAFDLHALIQVAEEAVGNTTPCINISKLPEGNFNKAFLVTLQDGREVIVKIPNPNAGPSHYTTASEVATMQYARENLQLPVPKVLPYCSRAEQSKLGTDKLEPSRRHSRARFPSYGSLYLRQDVSESESIKIDDTFAIGPTTGRTWFDDRRSEVQVHRGPCKLINHSTGYTSNLTTASNPGPSLQNTMTALVQREIACVNKLSSSHPDTQQGIFNGPDGYHPTKAAKRSVLQEYLKIQQYIVPNDNALNAGILWHNDLHTDNIFIDKANPTQITSIIDWQAIPIIPMFLIAHHPSLIEYDGPKPERFIQPRLPDNIDNLSPQERKAAKELHLSQTFWLYYETQVFKESRDLIHAFKYEDTLQSELMSLIGSIFDDGETHVQKLLSEVSTEDIWKQIVGKDEHGSPRVSCPLKYMKSELEMQRETYAKWMRDVERKARVLEEIGVYTGWNGAVSPGEYEEAVRRLCLAKERFLDREARTPEERVEWERVWPFEDK
ncbi:hypothetical protein BO94DRAFT_547313 [Aspergillus sclerotioniger CBS 115572]|uniref:Altered inheritance of mitochondria protein 9, mitochondrial n=1 Tax=Aspergillus sclerotioniger CBS 115572 TaxID=1450535 RepID=A0A317WBR6_9EURO|nr:hypothetical protein BO94DRAFT_547313 [Aspergillus sclerotioniger CBS 115572]PWY83649.1 hypothetical protein BO94DRAFT_547313 [Aspergillus sclerotioniger CBS 115572]